jgi:hypothetical protein
VLVGGVKELDRHHGAAQQPPLHTAKGALAKVALLVAPLCKMQYNTSF